MFKIKKSQLTPEELQSIKPFRLKPNLPSKGEKIFIAGDPNGFATLRGDEWISIPEGGECLGHSGTSGVIEDPNNIVGASFNQYNRYIYDYNTLSESQIEKQVLHSHPHEAIKFNKQLLLVEVVVLWFALLEKMMSYKQ